MSSKNEKKQQEKDLLKAYELSTPTTDFTPNTSSGQYRFVVLLLFLLLGAAAALLVFRFIADKMNPGLSSENSKNPLFFTGQEDDDIPDIPGLKVYDVRKDLPAIANDSTKHQNDFDKGLKELSKDEKMARDLEMMKKRDQFAGEKLELLKKIDDAENRKERIKAIRELEKKATGKGEKN